MEGRKIGILIADGSDAGEVAGLKAALEKAGGTAMIVAPKVEAVGLSDGKAFKADGQLLGSPSPIVDAVAIVLSEAGCKALLKEGALATALQAATSRSGRAVELVELVWRPLRRQCLPWPPCAGLRSPGQTIGEASSC